MDIVGGTISEDPLRELPVGSSIKFELIDFGGSDSNAIPQSVTNWRFFKGSILAVGFKSKDEHTILGTAVVVAPGIALSATHIFHDQLSEIESGQIQPYCFGIREAGLEIWRVSKLNIAQGDDIAILSIEAQSRLPEDATYYRLRMTTRAPKEGEILHVVGFRQASTILDDASGRWPLALYAASGSVSAVYPKGRDLSLIPYPVIELNCGSLGGMSGGAAFDAEGWLVGIISRGFTTIEGDGPTYLSWIIQSLHRAVEPTWPSGLYTRPMRLAELSPSHLLIERPEALTISD